MPQWNMIKTLQYQYENHAETGKKKSEHKTNCIGIIKIWFFFRWQKMFMIFYFVVHESYEKEKCVFISIAQKKLWYDIVGRQYTLTL